MRVWCDGHVVCGVGGGMGEVRRSGVAVVVVVAVAVVAVADDDDDETLRCRRSLKAIGCWTRRSSSMFISSTSTAAATAR